jgi:hypothetical protein
MPSALTRGEASEPIEEATELLEDNKEAAKLFEDNKEAAKLFGQLLYLNRYARACRARSVKRCKVGALDLLAGVHSVSYWTSASDVPLGQSISIT